MRCVVVGAFLFGAVGGTVATPRSAVAQPPPSEPSAADKETARTLFREGDERFRANDYEGALKAFRAADEIMRVPTTGLEHARTLMMLGRLVEARDLFIKVSNLEKRPDELAAQDAARDEAKQLAEDLLLRIPSVRVVLQNAPANAEVKVRIDEVLIPATAVEFPRKVDPGDHIVKVFLVGFKPVNRRISVVEKEQKVIEIKLEPSGEDASLVDPWEGGGGDGDGASFLPVLSWIGFSVGLAGLIVGVPTGVYAISEKGRLEELCNGNVCPAEVESDLDAALVVSHVSTVGFVFAGVGIAVGVTGLLLRHSLPDALARTDAPFTLRPFVGPGAVGFSGRF